MIDANALLLLLGKALKFLAHLAFDVDPIVWKMIWGFVWMGALFFGFCLLMLWSLGGL